MGEGEELNQALITLTLALSLKGEGTTQKSPFRERKKSVSAPIARFDTDGTVRLESSRRDPGAYLLGKLLELCPGLVENRPGGGIVEIVVYCGTAYVAGYYLAAVVRDECHSEAIGIPMHSV